MLRSLCQAANNPRFVGDPVDTLTGAVTEQTLDFRLTGPLEFWWVRHYSSEHCHSRFALGWGHAHDFERHLRFDVDGFVYRGPLGREVAFPSLKRNGDECGRDGFRLRRVTALRYEVHRHGESATDFIFQDAREPARLNRIFKGQHEISFSYGPGRRLKRIVDSAARRIRVMEEQDGRLVSLALEDELGRPGPLLVAYQYDERGNLISTTNADGHSFRFDYDHANRMVRRTGRMGFQFQFEYDAQGRCTKSAGDDRMDEVSLEYAIPRRLTNVTRADGGTWQYSFDESGGLTQVLDPMGGVQLFVRDDAGRVTLEVDPNGNATRVTYDASGAQVAKISPLGHISSVPENPNAPDPTAHRVAANAAEYELGRLLDTDAITLPTGRQAALLPVSAAARALLSTSLDEGSARSGHSMGFQAKPLGPMWWPTPKGGRVFNDLGKLVRQQDQCGRTRTWSYNASGNLEQHTDFDGNLWQYDYGAWHVRLALTTPIGAAVRFSYQTAGELASCIDAGGTRSEYRYNQKDHLVEVRRHGVVREIYSRDAVGNLTAKHAADGRPLLQFVIGPGNLPVKRTLASGDEHTFKYDKAGRFLTAASTKDVVTFAYDALGNCMMDKRNGQGVNHRYDGLRKPAESTYFGRLLVRYERSTKGVLTIVDPGGKKHRILLHDHGLIERQLSNGSRETAQYDDQGRCLFKCAERVSGKAWTRRYEWSGEGELRRVRDNMHGEVRHDYDSAHRLQRRVLPRGRTEEFEHDVADNLVRQPGLERVALAEGNRLRSANGCGFDYDDRNHVALRQTPDGPVRYSYDSRDQLVLVEGPEGRWQADYDALGRRTRKSFGGAVTEYYWNSDQLMAEQHSDGRLRLYLYADPLALTPILFLDYDFADALPQACRRYFVFCDQVGTPCLVEDESGAQVWRASIEPFGRADVSSSSKIDFGLRFPGHYFDPELELHYNRFRFYDPLLGRYLQSDPWGISGGYNLYAYRPNPLGDVDVRGLGEENEKKGEPCPDEEGTAKGKPTPEELDEKYGVLKDPRGVKDHEVDSNGVIRNPDLQEVTPGNPPNLDPTKKWLWLVDKDGRVWVGSEAPTGGTDVNGYPDRLGHPTLVNGEPARMGGEIKPSTPGGPPDTLNNNSGRYSMHPDRTPDKMGNVNQDFKNSGLDMKDPVDNPNRRKTS